MENPTRPSGAAIDAFLSRGGDLLATTDVSGRITWCNEPFGRETGLEHTAVGRLLIDLVLPSTTPEALTVLRQGFADGSGVAGVEIALASTNGVDEGFWCLVKTVPFVDAAGRGFACVLHDRRGLRQQQRTAQHLAELLDMAQDFGRLGVWERDIRTGEGHWDDHVFRFFDLPPADGTPDHDAARSRIHPEDRDDSTYVDSIRQPGRYSQRYRIVGDGDVPVRVIHSQWEVKSDADGVPTRAIGIMVDDTEAYEMSRSLTHANTRLALALELSGIGLWRHDFKTDRLYYDQQANRLLGWAPRPEGWGLAEARAQVHPDDLPAVAAARQRALLTNAPTDLEARYRHGDGRWRTMMTRRTVERDAAGEPIAFIGVGLDVTERNESARASVELGRRLDAITRAAGLGVWSASFETGAAEWNQRMFELYDLPPTTAPPTFLEFLALRVHPEDREPLKRATKAWLHEKRGAHEIEFRAVLSDGSVRWILSRTDMDLRAGEHLIYGVAIDITDRKRTEIALQEARERVALAAHGAGIGTWLFDPKSGETFWDDQMFLLRGLPPGPTALTVAERLAITHPDDRERVLDALDQSLRKGDSAMYEFRVQWPDGQWRWLASRSIPVLDDEGQLVRRTGVNWDVTEAKTNELERQDRMAAQRENQAKSKFLARISHELRTPLNAVLGFSQLLIGDSEQMSANQRRTVAHIHAAGEHLLALINDVLDISSLQSGELKMEFGAVSLERIVGETLPLLMPQARARGITIGVEGLAHIVWADSTRMRQVVINLVTNAIKYNRNGGEVHISARATDDAHVSLSVRDTGPGIHPSLIPQLFEPFNRLGMDREGIEGTGIGLAVVKSIVERQGGQVRVCSTLDVGSEFTVTLEGAKDRRLEARAAPPVVPIDFNDHRFAGTILYIEDNPVNVLIVEELIRRFPALTLHSAVDGATGVARARELLPDLVLVDMQLPDFDGFEVLRRLHADPATAKIPCVALSANAMPDDIALALRAGMVDYLTKPIDFRTFAESLGKVLARP